MEIEIFEIGIHHYKKTLVDVTLTTRCKELACRPAQNIAERQRYRIVPIFGGGLFSGWGHPGDVFNSGLGEHFATQKARAREDAMATAETDQIANEAPEVFILGPDIFPVDP